MKVRYLQIFAWSLSILVSLLAVATWGGLYGWQLRSLTLYQYFPLLGLLAFSLMWSHYVASAVRQYLNIERAALMKYFKATSYVVLFSFLMHPSLLILQLFLDGKGLPPFSYYRYVGAYGKIAVTMGTIAFVIFLTYELYRWLARRSWWQYVQYASDLGMVLIIMHSLRLGSHLQGGWYLGVWRFYITSFFIALFYSYYRRYQAAH